jgi:transcription-repair coupling factor (superfamily II helicase)
MQTEPEALLAARLLERAAAAGPAGLIFVARSDNRAARLHAAAAALAGPEAEALLLPAWDCLPYDRVSPSRAVMGARMAAVARLAEPSPRPRLLLMSVEAATQRLPRAADAGVTLEAGAPIDPDALRAGLERLGYVLDDSADEPGEVAVRGAVIDVFTASGEASLAVRVHHEDGRVTALNPYDPTTQRGTDAVEAVALRQASELVLPEDSDAQRRPGLEHALPAFCPDLAAPTDLLPGAAMVLDPEVEHLVPQRAADVAEAFRTRLALRPPQSDERPAEAPERLYLDEAAWRAATAGREAAVLEPGEAPHAELPDFLAEEEPEDAFVDFLEAALERRQRVGLVGRGRMAAALARLAAERLGVEPRRLPGWLALRAAPPGTFALLDAELDGGFATQDAAVLPVAKIRPRRRAQGQAEAASALADAVPGLQPGDAVIHFEHGLGALRGVEPVDTGGSRLDCVRLAYAADTARLVPFDELDRLWRYGASAENVSLDRLGSDAWKKRRAEAEAQVAETARRLLQMAREREGAAAPALRPPREAYARFADRFPFPLTPDQAGAIADTLRDLASGRPMDRLACGDVGFGKTEVALRAAAAAALAGKQVAVLAPTTVLARQHLETFRKRFAGFGLRVASLSRLSSPAEAKETKRALAAGEIRIAVGTHALAAKGVRFQDLGLVVIDEEQRFGTRQKAALRKVGEGVHVLTLTATPIPRTLQAALVGLQSLSVIATPPARRQPIRTARAPLDDALLTQALRREARRGGQSFVVCPRIEDIEPMRERVAGLLPDLSLLVAHGGMPPAEVDEALVRFAAGGADVLLSTNIVETGLDVPRANTMLVWRPDRFGLSQLHQLRGRVGRGRVRGVIYLLTDPAAPPAPATDRRLRTLEALDRVGAGFAISARDLDLRGAGDLLGEEQAGHLRLVGIELYRHMLDRALAAARGEAPPEQWTPHLGLDLDAFIPPEHVPEEALRVELHARLGELMRRADLRALRDMADEAEDRFGPPPEPFQNLLALARLAVLCRRLGVARLEVGPQAAAASFRGAAPPAAPPLEESKGRLILRRASADAAGRLEAAQAVLEALLPRRRRRREAA